MYHAPCSSTCIFSYFALVLIVPQEVGGADDPYAGFCLFSAFCAGFVPLGVGGLIAETQVYILGFDIA